MNIWAKITGSGRALSAALLLSFLCLVSPLLFGQASTPDIQQAAAAGDAQAQFALANDYFRARYVTLGYAEMLAWYRKSAAQGFAPAQNQLGSMYEHNVGLPQSDKRAAIYYRLAANQGLAPAQFNLAALLQAGRGVHRDYKQALAWYRKAADQGLATAEKEIGYFYQCGFGVKRDYAQALVWYRRAADHGNSDAENQLGYMAGEGWGQPQNSPKLFPGITKPQNTAACRLRKTSATYFRMAGACKPTMRRRCPGLAKLPCKVMAWRKTSSAGCINSGKALRPTMPGL
jgi:TPR repeat protein